MKISIITVSYNSASTIECTLQSVLRQTYKDIEYWIIDGRSTDSTMEIIRSYENAFTGRLHYLSEPDEGLYDAMNKGVRMATGDVVGILNSDDFFTSDDVIERVVNAFDDSIDAIYGDVHFVKNENLNKCVRYYSGRIFHPSLVKYGFIAPHPSFYIRKSVYMKYGTYSPDYKISADFELIAKICYKYKIKTKYIHMDFVTMRTGGASTRNYHNRMIGLREDIIACKRLGINTNRFNIYMKFLIKFIESLIIRH